MATAGSFPCRGEPGPAAQGELCFWSGANGRRAAHGNAPALPDAHRHGAAVVHINTEGKDVSFLAMKSSVAETLVCRRDPSGGLEAARPPPRTPSRPSLRVGGLQARQLTSLCLRLPSPIRRRVLERSPAGEPLRARLWARPSQSCGQAQPRERAIGTRPWKHGFHVSCVSECVRLSGARFPPVPMHPCLPLQHSRGPTRSSVHLSQTRSRVAVHCVGTRTIQVCKNRLKKASPPASPGVWGHAPPSAAVRAAVRGGPGPRGSGGRAGVAGSRQARRGPGAPCSAMHADVRVGARGPRRPGSSQAWLRAASRRESRGCRRPVCGCSCSSGSARCWPRGPGGRSG